MNNPERIIEQVVREAKELIARRQWPRDLRDKSLVALLDDLDDSKLPTIWKCAPIARRRRPVR